MDISSISNKTAKAISSLDDISTENFSKICKFFLQSLVKGASSVVIDPSCEEALCGISTIILEAAKHRSTPTQLKSILSELGASSEVANLLTDLYAEHGATILEHLESESIAASTIVGIDWRLDYSMRSKNAGRENTPMYFVSLRVKDRGLLRDINMIASIEEVQDLLSKVRDAVKQAERVLSTAEG